MSFMDKAKAAAEQAMVKAQQGVAQGQAKLDTYTSGKQNSDLLHALGAAYYAQQRQGGSADAVTSALAALDAAAAGAPIDLTAPAAPAAPPLGTPPAGTPSGDFTL